jgi:hypothetical protein
LAKADTAIQAHPLVNRLNLARDRPLSSMPHPAASRAGRSRMYGGPARIYHPQPNRAPPTIAALAAVYALRIGSALKIFDASSSSCFFFSGDGFQSGHTILRA